MKEILMVKGAQKLVNVCGKVQAGEKVLIVSDFTRVSIAKTVAAAVNQRNAEPVISLMPPRKMHGEALPDTVGEAMRRADIIFVPTKWSIVHTEAWLAAKKAGVRIVNMPAYEEEMLISGGLEADFEKQAPLAERVAMAFTGAKVARVVTSLGTDITLGIEGRDGLALTGLSHKPGEFSSPPDIEARVTPVEGTSEGVIMVDGSIVVPEIGMITEPIKITVKGGYAVKIEGGSRRVIFSDILGNAGDQDAYNIAELALGLNPLAKVIGVMLEDEGAWGTVHIAVGNSESTGGKVKIKLHLDMILRQPTVTLDGKVILDKEKLYID